LILHSQYLPIRILFVLIIILLALDWFSLPFELIHPFFDVNAEANIPTWLSSILLFLIGLCSFFIYIKSDSASSPLKIFSYFWLIFSLTYIFFSIDELAGLHEWTKKIIERKHYSWVYLYFPFVLSFFVYCFLYFRLNSRSQDEIRNWILLGMFISAVGGLGLEITHRYLFIYLFIIFQSILGIWR
jgi:hypothetical protein